MLVIAGAILCVISMCAMRGDGEPHPRPPPDQDRDLPGRRCRRQPVPDRGGGRALPAATDVQLAYGMSAFQSGLITFVAAAGRHLDEAGCCAPHPPLRLPAAPAGERLLASVSIAVMGLLSSSTPYLLAISLLFVGGFLRSLQFTALNAMAYFRHRPRPDELCHEPLHRCAAALTVIGRGACRLRAGSRAMVPRRGDADAHGLHHRLLRGGGLLGERGVPVHRAVAQAGESCVSGPRTRILKCHHPGRRRDHASPIRHRIRQLRPRTNNFPCAPRFIFPQASHRVKGGFTWCLVHTLV